MNMPPKPNSRPDKCERIGVLGRIKGFFYRLFYIVSLVWHTSPMILILMALMCLFEGVLPIIGAYISRDLINSVAALIGIAAPESVYESIFEVLKPVLFLLLLQFIYIILQKVVERVGNAVTVIAGELVVNHIKLKIIGKAKEVDQSSFDRPSFYEKLENANREAGMRPIQILRATFSVISSFISVVSFIAVLTTLSPIAPLVILITAIPGAFVTYIYRNRNFRYIRRHSRERREMNYYSDMMVNKDAAKEIKLLGLGDTFIGKYKSAFKKYFKGLKSLALRENSIRILVSVISALANCAIFAYVAYDVVFNNGLIGDYSLYTGALSSVMTYVTSIVAATATIYEGTLFIDNMIEFMKENPRILPVVDNPRLPEKGIEHTIVLDNVSFAYPGTERRVIDKLNLTLKTGERTVLVGLNGAGKTTLIKLITRLYDPTEGRILLDGHDLREYDPKAYYDMFGIIFQDFGKYAVTAEENIEFGNINGEKNKEKVRESARSSDADDFIERLPRGYDTPLTRMFEEDGIELSGGQWQKLSVARAFYKDSDFLILDEPTASLDALAEEAIFNRFKELSEGKMSIFVSHRLSSATTADKIIVINNGVLAESGTHEELMSKKGEYYRLFTTQASHYVDSSK